MEVERLLVDGETYVKNAEEALERVIINADQLYVWDNQVEVIDTFLADTEDISGGDPKIGDLRSKLRELKTRIEKKSAEFLAKAEGQELPEDPPEDEAVAEFESFGADFLKMANDALKAKVKDVSELPDWEEPLAIINSYLADSEPYAGKGKLPKIRTDLKAKKAELATKIRDIVEKWRQQDMAGGEDEGDD
ncbi:MAG: hypothetical protein HY556_04785 [Euryarchaeota archaeon]|nr:hypothetical protein [Euryarchaeota archaeon]